MTMIDFLKTKDRTVKEVRIAHGPEFSEDLETLRAVVGKILDMEINFENEMSCTFKK